MTLAEAMLYSGIRSILIATLAVWPAAILWRQLARFQTSSSRLRWTVLCLVPLFVPELWLGFTWRLPAARLSEYMLAAEALYAGLQLFRAVGVAFAARLILADSAVSQESLYAWRLLKPVPLTWNWLKTWILLHLDGPSKAAVIGWCLTALVCFQEFETAALLQVDRAPVTWTVWLFDAHAARQPLSDSFRMVVRPVMIELLLLAPGLLLMWRAAGTVGAGSNSPGRNGLSAADRQATQANRRIFVREAPFKAMVWLTCSLIVCVVWPVASSLVPLSRGLSAVVGNWWLIVKSAQQVLVSLGFAVAAAVVSLRLAATLVQKRTWWLTLPLLLPGLAGSLFTGILLLAAFQLPLLHWLYDTWLPLLLGLSLQVLPRAWLVLCLLQQSGSPAAVHSALLLQTARGHRQQHDVNRLIWKLRDARWFLAGLLIGHWCFWDVTISSILRPVQLEPIVTRLYNEMHYGRTESLVLIAVISLAAPPLAAAAVAVAWRLSRQVSGWLRRLLPGA